MKYSKASEPIKACCAQYMTTYWLFHVIKLIKILESSFYHLKEILTQPKAKGRLFPVPKGTVAIGGGCDNLRSQTTPRSQPAVPSPPATYRSS